MNTLVGLLTYRFSCRIQRACKEEISHTNTLLIFCNTGCELSYKYSKFKTAQRNEENMFL